MTQNATPEPPEVAETRGEGATAGVLQVGLDGQANYDLPLRVVPGRGDIQPTLSFAYRSNDGESFMGRGWQLAGISSIARCGRTVATDGFSRSVRYDDDDAFCLDGERLIKVAETAAFTDYRTENESFQLIRMYPGLSGPEEFRVRTINGEEHWYGTSAENARRPLSSEAALAEWMISRVEDPFGNSMRFVWSEPVWPSHEGPRGQIAEVTLERIEYTAHTSGLAPNKEVRFKYSAHSVPRTGYDAQMAWSREARLDEVSTWLDGKPVRVYNVTYDDSGPTSASRVTEIEECADAPKGANERQMICLPPTVFEWSVGDDNSTPLPWRGAQDSILSENYHVNVSAANALTGGSVQRYDASFASLDANGDGATDVAFVSDDDLYLHLSTGTNQPFFSYGETLTSIQGRENTYSAAKRFFVVDWNDDGRDDLLRLKPMWATSGTSAWPIRYDLEALVSTGTDFVAESTGLQIPAVQALPGYFHNPDARYRAWTGGDFTGFLTDALPNYDQSTAHMADFNGDGNVDFLACEVKGNTDCISVAHLGGSLPMCTEGEWTIAWGSRAPDGSPMFEDRESTGIDYPCGMARHPAFGRAPIGDATGDGLADVLLSQYSENGFYELLTYDGDTGGFELLETNLGNANSLFPTFADVNGDGLSDILSYHRVDNLGVFDVYSTTAFRTGEDGHWRFNVKLAQGDGNFVVGGGAPAEWGSSERVVRSRYSYCTGGTFPSCSVSDRRYSVHPTPMVPMDLNGDGRVDPVTFTVPEAGRFFQESSIWPDVYGWDDAHVAILTSGSNGDFSPEQHDTPVLASGSYEELVDWLPSVETEPRVGDFDGDGDVDVMILRRPFRNASETGPVNETIMQMHLNGRAGHERIIAVEDGVSNRTEIEYMQTSDEQVYTTAHDCDWPQRCDSSARTVVHVVRHHAGVGGTPIERAYQYADGRHDLTGRGWLGFRRRIEIDSATGATTVHHMDNVTRDAQTNSYPFAGRVVRRVVALQPGDSGDPFPDQSSQFIATMDDTAFAVQYYGARFHVVEEKRVQRTYEELIKVYPVLSDYDGLDVLTPISTSETSSAYDSALPFGERHVPTTIVATHPDGSITSVEQAVESPPAGEDAASTPWHVGRIAYQRSRSFDECATDTSYRMDYHPVHGGIVGAVRRPDEFAPGRSSAEREREWRQAEFQFDAFGHVVEATIRDSLGNERVSSSGYSSSDDYTHTSWSENALGHRTHYIWRERDGTQRSIIDPNGRQSWVVRDGFGRPRQVIAPGLPDQLIDFRSDGVGSYVESSQAGYGSSTQVFNSSGQLTERRVSARGADGTPAISVLAYEYDAAGRVTRSSEPFFEGDVPHWNVIERDGLGEVRRVTGTLPGEVRDSWRRPFERHQRDGEARTAELHLNLNGQVRTARGFGENVHMTFERCTDGRLLRAHDPAGNVSFSKYDALGRLFSQGDPDSGVTDTVFDAFDQVASVTDAEGRFADYSYDSLGRTIARTTSAGTASIEYDGGGFIGATHFSKSEDGIEQHFDFDLLGRLTRHSQNVDGIDYPFHFTYDSNGRLRTRSYPTTGNNPFVVTYSYDHTHGGLQQVDGNMSGLLWQAGAAAADGQLTHEVYGNGFETNRTFVTGTSVLETLTTSGTLYTAGGPWWPPFPYTETVQDWTYTYDDLGRVTSRHDGAHSFDESYSYHSNGQLASTTASECSNIGGPCAESFLYDELGNMTWSSASGTMRYDGLQPHAVSEFAGTPQEYDLTGNHLGDPVRRRVVYDGRNLPTELNDYVTGADVKLRYNAAGQRAASDGPNGFRVYFGEFERRGSEEVYRVPVGGAVAEVVRQPSKSYASTSYAHRGRRGSIEAVTGSNSVEMLANYAPFGEARNLGWTQSDTRGFAGNDYGFGGHEEEDSGGLVHMNARQFDPAMRGMTSPDPFVSAPYSVIGYNRYAYAFADPVNFGDPSGLNPSPYRHAASVADRLAGFVRDGSIGGRPVWVATFFRALLVEGRVRSSAHVVEPAGAIANQPRNMDSAGQAAWDHIFGEVTMNDEPVQARIYLVEWRGQAMANQIEDRAFNEALGRARNSVMTLGVSDGVEAYDQISQMSNDDIMALTVRMMWEIGRAASDPTAAAVRMGQAESQRLRTLWRSANDETATPQARGTARGELAGEVLRWVMSAAGGAAIGMVARGARVVGGVTTTGRSTLATLPVRTLRGRQGPLEFSGSRIRELRRRMRAVGYDPAHPIDIIEVDGRRIILDGHHRARAAGGAGIRDVPVRIWQVSDEAGAQALADAAGAAERLGLHW